MFPTEIFEKILSHCDGKTLKKARNVCILWRELVDYLTRETCIWKRCCFDDIPENELIQYVEKWAKSDDENDKIKWLRLYENWLNWHDIDSNIDFETLLMGDILRISCINVTGKYLAIGFENGTVKIYINTDNFNYIKTYRRLNVPVCSVSIACDEESGEPSEVLVYQAESVTINDFCDTEYQPAFFGNCFKFSSYKKFICGVTVCGRITIAKIGNDHINQCKVFHVLTYVRIYSPDIVISAKLWEGVCTILVFNKVKIIKYNTGVCKSVVPELKASLQFSSINEYNAVPRDIYIFNNKIIISLTKCFDSMNQQIFELYILGENNQHFKKMFVPWHTLKSNISCMFLYGNTFLIGLVNGSIHFYEVHDWKCFDIKNFKHKEKICVLTPILSIDVIESHGKRVFFVATSMKIYQLTGFSIPGADEALSPRSIW